MAFDKGQLVMHQLQVKAKRLESGLQRLVEAIREGREQGKGDAYYYALGCLGGDCLKKELFNSDAFEKVVSELRDQKLMKVSIADKNISVWREKHTPKVTMGVDLGVKPSETVIVKASVDGVGSVKVESVETKTDKVVSSEKAPDETPENIQEKVPESAPFEKPMIFGTYDADGNLVPVKKETKAAYTYAPSVESKNGVQPAGLCGQGDGSSQVRRGPIYCY